MSSRLERVSKAVSEAMAAEVPRGDIAALVDVADSALTAAIGYYVAALEAYTPPDQMVELIVERVRKIATFAAGTPR